MEALNEHELDTSIARVAKCHASCKPLSHSSLSPFYPSRLALELMRAPPSTQNDKERIRLIKTLCNNFTLSSAQAAKFCAASHWSSAQVEAAVILFKSLTDPENFGAVRATFKWDEERAEVKTKLGLP